MLFLKMHLFKAWYKKWMHRIQKQKDGEKTSKLMMLKRNPAIIPRNHLCGESVITCSEGTRLQIIK